MRYRRKNKALRNLIFILILLMIIYCIAFFEKNIRPVITSVAVANAQNTAVKAVNKVIDEAMSEYDITYSDLTSIQTDTNGRITAVSLNSVTINRLKADMSVRIQERMSKLTDIKVRVPLGTFTGNSLFSGAGPRVTVRLVPVGYSNTQIKSEFASAGINQTKHNITLEVTTRMSVLMPFASSSTEVTSQVAIAETIIVGTVPETYTSVQGASDKPEDIVLNMLP